MTVPRLMAVTFLPIGFSPRISCCRLLVMILGTPQSVPEIKGFCPSFTGSDHRKNKKFRAFSTGSKIKPSGGVAVRLGRIVIARRQDASHPRLLLIFRWIDDRHGLSRRSC